MLTHCPLGDIAIILNVIFKNVSVVDAVSISSETAPRRMSKELIDEKSAVVQVMALSH